jgi:lipoprotein-releasing system permease protein
MMFSWKLASRYFLAGKTQTVTMVCLVAVGVLLYVFVSAALNGVQTNTVGEFLGAASHATIEPYDRQVPVFKSDADKTVVAYPQPIQAEAKEVSGWQGLIPMIARTPGVIAVSPLINSGCVVVRGAISRSANIRGMDPGLGPKIVDLNKYIVAGSPELKSSSVILGSVLARRLGVDLNERVRVTSGANVTDSFRVTGIVKSANFQMNETLLYMTLADAQRLTDMAGKVSAIETKVNDVFKAEVIAKSISDRTGYKATPWMTENGQLLNILNDTSIIFGIIRAFSLAAVAFGIASVLSVAVSQRSKEIGILKGMGATRAKIVGVFLILGLVVGLAGGLVGSTLSYYLITAITNLKPPGGGDGPSPLKFSFQVEYFTQGLAVATIVSCVGAILPARKASLLDPLEAIRG